jgi:hypothetical protein
MFLHSHCLREPSDPTPWPLCTEMSPRKALQLDRVEGQVDWDYLSVRAAPAQVLTTSPRPMTPGTLPIPEEPGLEVLSYLGSKTHRDGGW